MQKKAVTILVLGSDGLVGRTTLAYLQRKYPRTTFGTVRKNEQNPVSVNTLFELSVENFKEDYKRIVKKIGTIDCIINCIGCTNKNADSSELTTINGNFPHTIEESISNTTTKLIHISSDAVFYDLAGTVTEDTSPSPQTVYGRSKLVGETTAHNALTIRTSFLGFNSKKESGLLEWLRRSSDTTLSGFANHNWSGCTTYQFAQLCESLIEEDNFTNLRKQTAILHFAPLQATKYAILQTSVRILNLPKKIKKVELQPITRVLTSLYTLPFTNKKITNDLSSALSQAWQFEQQLQKENV